MNTLLRLRSASTSSIWPVLLATGAVLLATAACGDTPFTVGTVGPAAEDDPSEVSRVETEPGPSLSHADPPRRTTTVETPAGDAGLRDDAASFGRPTIDPARGVVRAALASASDAGSDAAASSSSAETATRASGVATSTSTSTSASTSASTSTSATTSTGTSTSTSTDVAADAGPDSADSAAPPACATKLPLQGIGVFLVYSTEPAVGACGLISNPCTDLASAIAALSDTRKTIYVGPGLYTPVPPATEFPALPPGTSIVGGWEVSYSADVGYTFSAECGVNAMIATRSSAAVLTVGTAAEPASGTVTLDGISLMNSTVAAPGQSLYGIFSVGAPESSLVLSDVVVSVANGGAGAAGGASDVPGQPGVAGGCFSGGGNGAAGAPGLAGGPTTYGPDGAMFGSEGMVGAAGSAGATGSLGGQVCSPENPTECTLIPGARGWPECLAETPVSACAPPPLGGCGGGGGGPGGGGFGGGSSIGVFAWGTAVTIDGSTLRPGSGGEGGAGGAGSPGGAGGPPNAPLTVDYVAVSDCRPNADRDACLGTVGGGSVTATPGTAGGPGGAGGQGGGGAGGDSYAYYLGGGATAALEGVSSFAPGAAGAGGAPNGVAGVSAATNQD